MQVRSAWQNYKQVVPRLGLPSSSMPLMPISHIAHQLRPATSKLQGQRRGNKDQLGIALHSPPTLFLQSPHTPPLPDTTHPPTDSMQNDMQCASRLIHKATARLPSTSPARWRRHRQFHLLSPQRRARHACAHQRNRLWARSSSTSGALRLPPAPRKPWLHIVAPTASNVATSSPTST